MAGCQKTYDHTACHGAIESKRNSDIYTYIHTYNADIHTLHACSSVGNCLKICTGWRRLVGSPKLQIIFHKRATKYRALLLKMTWKDKASYESSPPCILTSYYYDRKSSVILPRDVLWRPTKIIRCQNTYVHTFSYRRTRICHGAKESTGNSDNLLLLPQVAFLYTFLYVCIVCMYVCAVCMYLRSHYKWHPVNLLLLLPLRVVVLYTCLNLCVVCEYVHILCMWLRIISFKWHSAHLLLLLLSLLLLLRDVL